MHLTPHKQERELLSDAAELAHRRRARGLLLNAPETVTVLSPFGLEGARDGCSMVDSKRSLRCADRVLTAGLSGVGQQPSASSGPAE